MDKSHAISELISLKIESVSGRIISTVAKSLRLLVGLAWIVRLTSTRRVQLVLSGSGE
jgi:hypothetical protein